MTKEQKVALREKVRHIKDTIERDHIKIIYKGAGPGGSDVELNKDIGGYLTTAYLNNLLAFIEHLK